VYRTLELLVQMGIVLKFDFGDGRARYELAEDPKTEHHHHLICMSCKRVINYSDFMDEEKEFLKQAEKGLSKKYNFEIKNHVIQFLGLCEKCKKQEV
jgi:Fur family ferric uptake transcriptional regulator